MIEILPATKEDAEKFYGTMPMKSFRGYVAKDGDEVLGIAGVYYDGDAMIGFSEMKPEMRKHKKIMVKAIRMMCEAWDKMSVPVYAVCSKKEKTSQYLLIRMGFRPTGVIGPEGEVMVRR